MKFPTGKEIITFFTSIAERAAVLLVVAYIIFSVGRSVMKNYEMNRRITTLKNELAAVEREKSYLRSLIAYYQTDTFKELKAREELGFQREGEKVLSVPVEPEDRTIGAKSALLPDEPEPEKPQPNYQKWYNYFFGA